MTPDLDDLVAFLRARYDEAQHVIQQAAEDYFYADGHGRAVRAWFDHWSPDNPDGMLAEIEAKRAILDWIVGELADDETDETAQWLLRVKAQPYASHSGYREEWKPEPW